MTKRHKSNDITKEKRNETRKKVLTAEEELALIEKKRAKAEKLLANEKKFDEFLAKLEAKLKDFPCGSKLSQIPIMVAMIKSYWKKEYTAIPTNSIVSIVACLIYWLSPFDIIPDSTPVVGYADDAAFIAAMCLAGLDADIKEYIEWRDKLIVIDGGANNA